MRTERIGQTAARVEHGDAGSILYSYSTPVAAFVPGRGYLRTDQHYSVTTSRHVNAWARGGAVVPQSEIDRITGR
jgi:hypothetical protein